MGNLINEFCDSRHEISSGFFLLTNQGFSYRDIKHLRLGPFIRPVGARKHSNEYKETVRRLVSAKEKNIENFSRLTL